jgi:hypothetical protein
MTPSFGTNSAGTNEWLAATKDMQLSAAEPAFSHAETTVVVTSNEPTKQDSESALKKVSRRTSVSQSAPRGK